MKYAYKVRKINGYDEYQVSVSKKRLEIQRSENIRRGWAVGDIVIIEIKPKKKGES